MRPCGPASAHPPVARRLAEGTLQLHGMYFHVAEAQSYLLTEGASAGNGLDEVFAPVSPSRSSPPLSPSASPSSAPSPAHAPTDPVELARTGA
ncbi:hypothetical protein EAO72_28105 [Streptomyces sp. or43]|nr:hypothetical protein EAO72_28105 [Streptomyces sp. or43]